MRSIVDAQELKRQASGRWLGIFSSLGIVVPEIGSHGPCPVCGGKDRFRLDHDSAETGSFFCGQCKPNAGDGLELVRRAMGADFPQVLRIVSGVIGDCEAEHVQHKPEIDPAKALNSLWKASKPLDGKDPVSQYLRARGIVIERPKCLRYCPQCYESKTKTHFPAMIAKVTSPDGKPVSLHRTYLDGKGGKAPIESAKKLMKGKSGIKGSAIRLYPPKGDLIGVSEGIETAISATQLFNIPTWALISTSIMEGFVPPDGIRRVTIFSDNDANYAGQKSAYALANKLFLNNYIVEVVVPDDVGDFNNVILEDNE